MQGYIRLGRWMAFEATQVLAPRLGYCWAAKVRWGPLSFEGYDHYLGGAGGMRWDIYGRLPMVRAAGPQISRSAAGRAFVEGVLVPSALLDPAVSWTAEGPDAAAASWTVDGQAATVHLVIAPDGALRRAWIERYGNQGGGPFCHQRFGVVVTAERTFDGATVPSEMRAGWWPVGGRFAEGDFFRARITDLQALTPPAG